MPQPGKTHHLLAELLRTLRAEGYPLGTGQQLKVQELLRKLPEDTPIEELPYLLAPLFAHNPKEQARFYELFEQCRKRTEAFYQDIEREELAEPNPQERRYRGLIWLFALLLLIPPVIMAYWLMQPVERSSIEKPFQVQGGGKAEVCLSDSTDLEGFGRPESYEVLYPGKGNLGSFLVVPPRCMVYIAQDSIEGRDSVVVEWTNAGGQKLAVIYKATILAPLPDTAAIDTFLVDEMANQADTFGLISYPFSHDPLAFKIQPPSYWQVLLSKNFWWLKWVGFLLFTALLLAVWMYRAYRRRELVAELEAGDKPPYAWNIRIDGVEAVHLGDDFGYLLNLIRQRTGSEAFRLDVPKTIGATIEQGGMPTFRFMQQTKPPEYLLLIDQQTPRNHRARLMDLLFRVFLANEVLIERFFYDSDPRVCYNEEHPEGLSLQQVQQRYPSSRLIFVGYGNALLSKLTGKLAPWSRLLGNWKHRLLLTPRPTGSWGKRERRLGGLFTLLPLSMQSLLFWLQELEMEEDARFDTWPDRVKDAPKESLEFKEALIPSLEAHFRLPMLQWIAACAVYPSLHWDLTLYLGQQLSIGKDNLLSFENLLQLTRLPWFTEGRIPQASRISLVSWLEAEHPALLEQVRTQLADILQQNPPPSDSAAFEDYRMNVALNEWLTTKNRRLKKERQQEISGLLAVGGEADVTVIKQLKRKRHPLDFILPDNLKKYFRPHGLPGLGWRGEWRDVLFWALALPLWLLALLLAALPWQIQPSGCDAVKVQYQLGDESSTLCLYSPEAFGTMVEAHVRAAIQNDTLPDASALSTQALLWQTADDVLLRFSVKEKEGEASWEWETSEYTSDTNTWGSFIDIVDLKYLIPGSLDYAFWNELVRIRLAPRVGSSSFQDFIFYGSGSSIELWRRDRGLGGEGGENRLELSENWKAEYRSNIAIAFYNKGVELLREYEPGQAPEDVRQYICRYFQNAALLDSTQLDMYKIRSWCGGVATSGAAASEACYTVANVNYNIALRTRPLTQREMNELNASLKKGLAWEKQRINRETFLQFVPLGRAVALLEEGDNHFRIEYEGQEGYIVNSNGGQPTLLPCPEPNVGPAPKTHTPRYLWCLHNPHGSDTPGKRSPVFDDGKTQLFEYRLSRDVVDRIIRRLEEIGVAYYRVVPEEEDIGLQERVRRINDYDTRLPKVAVSVHFNISPLEEGVTGWLRDGGLGAEAWNYAGSQWGRRLGAIFLDKVIRKTGLRNRFLKEKQAGQYYLLRKTRCVTTLVKNGFLNNRADAALLAQPAFRQRLADAYVAAILEIERYGLADAPAPLIDEEDSDGDEVANSEDGCPFTAGPAGNRGCPREEQEEYEAPLQKQQGKVGEFPKIGQFRRGNGSYRTIQFEVGGPVWLGENLDYVMRDSWCYDDDPKNCEAYGRLYTWAAAREACRQFGEGWRLPTDGEWQVLANLYGGATTTDEGGEESFGALIKGGVSGFDAQLSGWRDSKGQFDYLGDVGSYWTATESDKGTTAFRYNFHLGFGRLRQYNTGKYFGFSCRCLKD